MIVRLLKILKFKFISFLGIKFYLGDGKNSEGLEDFFIDVSSFTKERPSGFSALYRVKNEGEFLMQSVLSCVDFFDEVVIIYNESTDDTVSVISELSGLYPRKIRSFLYPEVYAFGHARYGMTSKKSVHNLSYYYNFGLSKTRYRTVMKIDGDDILVSSRFDSFFSSFKGKRILGYRGLNLMYCDETGSSPLGVNTRYPYAGGHDHFMFTVSGKTFFVHDSLFETFVYPGLMKVYDEILYLHAKGLKEKDHSLGVSEFAEGLYHYRWNHKETLSVGSFDESLSSFDFSSLLGKKKTQL